MVQTLPLSLTGRHSKMRMTAIVRGGKLFNGHAEEWQRATAREKREVVGVSTINRHGQHDMPGKGGT